MEKGLVGQVALVTGASSGIGRAIALALAARGVAVGLVGRDAGRLRDVAKRAIERTCQYRVDLAAPDASIQLAGRVAEDFGRLDILVHAAGQFGSESMAGTAEEVIHQLHDVDEPTQIPAELLDRLYAVNVRAPYALTHSLVPLLIRAQGQIVLVNSSVVRFPNSSGAYASTKQALEGLAGSLRAQLNESGVRVLSIFPGRTATSMQEQVHAIEGRAYHPDRLLQPEDVASTVMHALELPRTAEITEIHIRPMAKP